MLHKSSNGVKVIFSNKEKILLELKKISTRIITKNPQVKTILLFGSYVQNTYTPHSDADILIVLKKSKEPILNRIPKFQKEFLDASVSVDVFPYTEKEIARMKKNGNFFIKRAIEKSIVLS